MSHTSSSINRSSNLQHHTANMADDTEAEIRVHEELTI